MAEVTGRYIDVEGCRTYFEVAGSGKTVLFLAPAGRETSHWQEYLPEIGRSYRAVALDLPGHGKSARHPNGPYLSDVESIIEFIDAFLSRLGIDELALVGCSLGGSLTYAFASTFPDAVDAIVPLEGCDFSPVVGDRGLALLEHPRVNHVEYLTENVLGLTGSSAPGSARAFLIGELPNVNALALRADLAAYGSIDLRDKMSDITSAVLSVRGLDDWIVGHEQVQGTLSRLSSARTVEHHDLEGIGHWPHIEASSTLLPLVADFLDRHF